MHNLKRIGACALIGVTLLSCVGCSKNTTINDIVTIDKTPTTETKDVTKEETKTETETTEKKDDYSWASYDVVKAVLSSEVSDDKLLNFYLGASESLWANASPNFKLNIGKNDSYFWNTIGYNDFSAFLKDYYVRQGFTDVPDYVITSMSNIVSYDMIWQSLNQDWTKISQDYVNEGMGLGYYIRNSKLPEATLTPLGNTSNDSDLFIINDDGSITGNAKYTQICKYGSENAIVAIPSQRYYAVQNGLSASDATIGVNYVYWDRDTGGIYYDMDTDGDGVANYRSLITATYMKNHKDNPSGFIYLDPTDDTSVITDSINAYVGTNVLTDYTQLLSDIQSGAEGIYTYPIGQPTSTLSSTVTNNVKVRLESSAGSQTQGAAIASYIYYWKNLYGNNTDTTSNNSKTTETTSSNSSTNKTSVGSNSVN